jgi:N-acetylmuramoyl-L-alanine amidase
MQHKLIVLLFILLQVTSNIYAMLPVHAVPNYVDNKKPKAQAKKINVVIIDAGHGGKDVGAVGLQSTEKQITLAVAKKLYKRLSQNYPDIKFIMTRTKDVFDNVKVKAQKANNAKGDLFICIHVNSGGKKPGGWYQDKVVGYQPGTRKPILQKVWVKNEAHGTETYVWAADKTESKTSHISNAQKRYISSGDTAGIGAYTKSPEAKITASIKAKKYFKNSVRLANYLEQEYAKVGRYSRGVRQRNDEGIWVLQATSMPSILTEIGFNSNIEEEAYMVSNDGQNQIVDCISNAFSRYRDEIENPNLTLTNVVRKRKVFTHSKQKNTLSNILANVKRKNKNQIANSSSQKKSNVKPNTGKKKP